MKATSQSQPSPAAQPAPRLPRGTTDLLDRGPQTCRRAPGHVQNPDGWLSESDSQPHSGRSPCSMGIQSEPGCESPRKAPATPQGLCHSIWEQKYKFLECGARHGQLRKPAGKEAWATKRPYKEHKNASRGCDRDRHLPPKEFMLPFPWYRVATGRRLPRQNYISQHPLH